ncbi:MAG: imidazolonepropionase [Bacteroidota bacterium]|nr:imidazolonepropionase [Bacteroidota bacterium]
MRLLIKNIKELVQVETSDYKIRVEGKKMSEIQTIKNAFLYIEDEKISSFGKMDDLKSKNINYSVLSKEIDASGRMVFPSYCDSHTHLIYSGSREREFIDKINGLTYEEIAKRGGGILNSAMKLHDTSDEVLLEESQQRLEEIIKYGTGAVEIKSGYGLTVKDEIKMLRVIKKLKSISPLKIKSTFLGAHALPLEYKDNRKGYIDLIINRMLPQIAGEGLADYCDVFCDKGFFTIEETDKILKEAAKYGMKAKLHVNELDNSGGVQVGVKNNALSVDHLERIDVEEIKVLKNKNTMPTLLPTAAFFLNLPYPPARKMIDSGLGVALASDFNPGSSPSGNMQLVSSLACIKLRMNPEEVINASTINSAYAMDLSKDYGSIAVGKKANIFITTKMNSYPFLQYSFGSNNVETVILDGKLV